jgi:hypothetical protein
MKATLAVFLGMCLSWSPVQGRVARYANTGTVNVGNRSANVNRNANVIGTQMLIET